MTYYQVWQKWCEENPEISKLNCWLVYFGFRRSCTFDVLRNIYHV